MRFSANTTNLKISTHFLYFEPLKPSTSPSTKTQPIKPSFFLLKPKILTLHLKISSIYTNKKLNKFKNYKKTLNLQFLLILLQIFNKNKSVLFENCLNGNEFLLHFLNC